MFIFYMVVVGAFFSSLFGDKFLMGYGCFPK